MTCHTENTQFELAMELLIENGFDGLASAITILLNAAMKIERSRFLRADHYERSEHRRGYANGYKPKTVKTRVGEITAAVPQTRDSQFYPGSLEKGLRSERALKIALAESMFRAYQPEKSPR